MRRRLLGFESARWIMIRCGIDLVTRDYEGDRFSQTLRRFRRIVAARQRGNYLLLGKVKAPRYSVRPWTLFPDLEMRIFSSQLIK